MSAHAGRHRENSGDCWGFLAANICTCPPKSISTDFRFAIAGRTRDAGLGSYPAITLVTAREEAEYRRRLVAAGVDPIDAKRKEREAELLATSKAMTFEQCAKSFIAAYSADA